MYGCLWYVAAPLIAVMLILVAARDAGPAYTAQFGSPGTQGTFTATEEHSGKGGPGFSGRFVSDDGSVVRADVRLVGDEGVERVGDEHGAYDTGHPHSVYSTSGSSDWLLLTVLGLAAVIVLVLWAVTVVRRFRNRPRAVWPG